MSGRQSRDDAGAVSAPVEQSAAAQNPMQQMQLGNFQGMSIEQLQEAALRLHGSPQGQLAQRVLEQKRIAGGSGAGDPRAGDPRAGDSGAGDSGGAPNPAGPPQGFALGGTLNPAGGLHITERGIGGGGGGFLHTAGPGRSDNLHIHPHADSYVLPADSMSGSGEGNSLSGAKAFDMALHSGPGGIALPAAGKHHYGAPHARSAGGGFAAGGTTPASKPTVPIVAAGGERVVTPEEVQQIGRFYGGHGNGGDTNHGHAILDALVLLIRDKQIKDLKRLKGPVKS